MDRGSQLSKDDEDDEDDKDDKDDKEDEEDEEERRRRRRTRREAGGRRQEEATDIKANNPHLAGGENHGKSPCLMGKSMNIHYFDWAIFNSYVSHFQRVDE